MKISILAALMIAHCAAALPLRAETASHPLHVRTLEGHSQAVTSVDFSPDGKTLASGSWDETVKIWDLAREREPKTLAGHGGWVKAVAFSPDGKLLASAGSDKSVKLWDTFSWKAVKTLEGHSKAINALAFSPGGRWLASASDDESVRIWDVASGKKIKSLGGHKDAVLALSISADGKFLASAGRDFSVRIYDTSNWKELIELSGVRGHVQAVAFSPDGRIVVAAAGHEILVWGVRSWRRVRTINDGQDEPRTLHFLTGGKYLASSGLGNQIKILDMDTGGIVRVMPGHSMPVNSARFSPGGRILASASNDRLIKIWSALQVFVVNANAPLKNPLGETLLRLPAGTRVSIERSQDQNVYVQVKDSLRGWLAKDDIAFTPPDLRRPVVRMISSSLNGSTLTLRGVAYDDARVQSVHLGDRYFERAQFELEPSDFNDAFPFEETLTVTPGVELTLRAEDESGKASSARISDQAPIDFKPRYGTLLVQSETDIREKPAANAPPLFKARPGAVLNSIGFKDGWYRLEDEGWVVWTAVQDQEPAEEEAGK